LPDLFLTHAAAGVIPETRPGWHERHPCRQTSLACETKSDGKRIDALDAPIPRFRLCDSARKPDEQNQKSSSPLTPT
jgi:hypothetical protein